MPATWLENTKGKLRLSRVERALTLAIFLLFQALLPSYAGALSNWSGDDRLVLCTAHGLIDVGRLDQSKTDLDDGTLCLVAQSGAADMVQPPVVLQFQPMQIGASALAAHQLVVLQGGLHFSPHAPRAPPIYS
ncbi:hypothetical protein [Maritalea sp.]|jgi:hypothetical protein|uniref:hypothetical protein n=1 Tax=Maritalea sp. TaxID=2003361 RepID=UPI0039E26224